MKMIFVSLMAATLLVACGSANRTTNNSTSSNEAFAVPNSVRENFNARYPNARNVNWSAYDAQAATTIDWELNGWNALNQNDYMVTFDQEGRRYTGWYDRNGNWVGSTYTMTDYKGLPAAVMTTIDRNYQGYEIVKVQQEFWRDMTAYEVKLKRNNDDKVKLLVDANGNIIKHKNKD